MLYHSPIAQGINYGQGAQPEGGPSWMGEGGGGGCPVHAGHNLYPCHTMDKHSSKPAIAQLVEHLTVDTLQ